MNIKTANRLVNIIILCALLTNLLPVDTQFYQNNDIKINSHCNKHIVP